MLFQGPGERALSHLSLFSCAQTFIHIHSCHITLQGKHSFLKVPLGCVSAESLQTLDALGLPSELSLLWKHESIFEFSFVIRMKKM